VVIKLHSLNEVIDCIVKYLKINLKGIVKKVGIADAVGKYLAEDIRASMDIPPYDRSVLDGYAVIYEDIALTRPESPVKLRVVGNVDVDEFKGYELRRGEAIKVSTGSPLPRNASAVIPKEGCVAQGDYIYVYNPVPPNYGVSKKGEDLRRGELIVSKGTLLRPWHVGLIASQGIPEVLVYEPKACMFSVGDEVIDVGKVFSPGKVYASTTYLVLTYLKELGFRVRFMGFIGDDEEAIVKLLRKSLNLCDFVFTTGGTSVGERDLTVRALRRLSPEVLYHGVALIPGKPMAIAVVNGKLVMCLSGFPVAALAELEVVLKPLLSRVLGMKFFEPRVIGRLGRRLSTSPNMNYLIRVKVSKVGNEYVVTPLKITGSGVLSTLVKGNGVLLIREGSTGVDEGDLVEVTLLSNVEGGGCG